jgi:hypothetical protein
MIPRCPDLHDERTISTVAVREDGGRGRFSYRSFVRYVASGLWATFRLSQQEQEQFTVGIQRRERETTQFPVLPTLEGVLF